MAGVQGGCTDSSVATQSAKTDILQKIGQRGNNHEQEKSQETQPDLLTTHEEDSKEKEIEDQEIYEDEDNDTIEEGKGVRQKFWFWRFWVAFGSIQEIEIDFYAGMFD